MNIHKKVHAIILSVVLLLSGTIVFFNAIIIAPAHAQEQQRIAFVSGRDRNNEIYVMNSADGSGQTNISNNPAIDIDPDFGPATCEISPPPIAFLAPLLTPAYAQSASCGDLSVTSVSAVQAPFDPDFLVYGKPTLIKARVSNTFNDTKTVAVKLNADTPYEKIIPEVALQPGTHDYFLPTEEYITPTTGSSLKPSVEVDTFNVITTEASEGNNIKVGQEYQVKETKDLKILYVPLRISGDAVAPPSCEDVDSFMRNSENYLEAVFPVNPERTIHSIDCDFAEIDLGPLTGSPRLSDEQENDILRILQELAWEKGIDHVVGVARGNWFQELRENNDVGISFGEGSEIDSTIVEVSESVGTTTAHEIAHTYDEEHKEITAPGYWVTERVPTSQFPDGANTVDFMSADPDLASDRIDVWVSKHTFDYLLGMLKAPGTQQ